MRSNRWRSWIASRRVCLWLSVLIVVLTGVTEGRGRIIGKSPEKMDERIEKMRVFFEELQSIPESRIPGELLAKAQGLIIMRNFKVGLIVGAQVGAGVATVRDPRTGQWSAPAFVNTVEGSYGFQIGGQKADTVMLLMNDRGMEVLRRGGLKFGVDVRATAGPVSAGGDWKADTIKEPVLVYTNAGGLFAGAAIEGGGIGTADEANYVYHGASSEEVLFQGKGRLTETGQRFLATIRRYEIAR
jgi:SH3 domain-containing YSC84-like protein 1